MPTRLQRRRLYQCAKKKKKKTRDLIIALLVDTVTVEPVEQVEKLVTSTQKAVQRRTRAQKADNDGSKDKNSSKSSSDPASDEVVMNQQITFASKKNLKIDFVFFFFFCSFWFFCFCFFFFFFFWFVLVFSLGRGGEGCKTRLSWFQCFDLGFVKLCYQLVDPVIRFVPPIDGQSVAKENAAIDTRDCLSVDRAIYWRCLFQSALNRLLRWLYFLWVLTLFFWFC